MKLSIIIPVYNSELILAKLHKKINNVVSEMNIENNFEIIFINDFSEDNSWDEIIKLSKKFEHIKGVNLTNNFGQHNAIMAGLGISTGEKIITLDDDLQHSPSFFPQILEELKNYDVCYTSYINRKHKLWKKILSYLNNLISSFLLNKPLNIYMSSFRGLNRKIVNNILNFKRPDVYIDGLIINITKKIKMIDVEHYKREYGESNYTFKKLFILWSKMILNFSFFPFRVSSIFGIFLKIVIKLLIKKNRKPQFEIKELINVKL
tara:strand:+ start:4194 stop:4982 length:789 start_codon:yes stop_codon:yes gene_type:complete